MSFSLGKTAADDQRLVDYLLAALPADETEQFDELSIADDEFSWRLNAVENELVDAYVKGELPPATRERFQSTYLASEARREKVRFAEALLSRKAPAVARQMTPRRWNLAGLARWQWAAAALVLVAAFGYLFYNNWRLRTDLTRQAVSNQMPDVQLPPRKQVERQPGPAVPEGRKEALSTAVFVMAGQTRGAGGGGRISIPPRTDRVVLRLQLESDDFPLYSAAVRDPATNQVIWTGSDLKSEAGTDGRLVSMSIPRALLKPQHYTVELTGISAGGASAFAGSYVFRVVE
jgi:hypothetical protein